MSVYSKRKDGERERERERVTGRELEEGYFVKSEVKYSGVGKKRTERQGRSRERERKQFIVYVPVTSAYACVGLFE